ncbi:hypothetical protein RO624_11645 [Ruminococcus bromii]|nr:hypothetical protein [Ruminococcus bromii]MDT4342765.1 hypothetical protein [Ruminococcus bromii]
MLNILYLSILIFLRVIAQTNTNLSELVNCGIKRQVSRFFFVAVPNRETDILAYSDSLHKADKTVTFGKFRIFCFVESENNSYTGLLVDSEKIHLEKTKRKGMYFIGLDEVTKTDQKSKK